MNSKPHIIPRKCKSVQNAKYMGFSHIMMIDSLLNFGHK